MSQPQHSAQAEVKSGPQAQNTRIQLSPLIPMDLEIRTGRGEDTSSPLIPSPSDLIPELNSVSQNYLKYAHPLPEK